uniref:Uncharacterized protein n=1 Tax=Daphnia galeata TaxID=27404 RepID=A0A8J2RVQ1_9CRUS|nr:unnamed protein product [Daphnia galeata]
MDRRASKPKPAKDVADLDDQHLCEIKLAKNKLSHIIPAAETTTTHRDYSKIPVVARDNRMIMYYLKRPAILQIRSVTFAKNNSLVPRLILSKMQKEFNNLPTSDQEKLNKALVGRNGLVVEYSPVQSAVVGCNTNASLLGSDAQTKAALCYVLKYVTKPPVELAHSLSLLHHARRTIELHPSKAADTGSVIRTGMHYLNRIVNQLNGAIEISAPMAAVAIQGMPAELCSDSFWVAYVTAASASPTKAHLTNLMMSTQQLIDG